MAHQCSLEVPGSNTSDHQQQHLDVFQHETAEQAEPQAEAASPESLHVFQHETAEQAEPQAEAASPESQHLDVFQHEIK